VFVCLRRIEVVFIGALIFFLSLGPACIVGLLFTFFLQSQKVNKEDRRWMKKS